MQLRARARRAPARRVERPTERQEALRAGLVDAEESIAKLASRLRSDMGTLRGSHEAEDLVQEVYAKALGQIDTFRGGSALKTWVIAVARNHLLSLARAAKVRPKTAGDLVLERPTTCDPSSAAEKRELTDDLVLWLKANPEVVPHGWEVLTLLLRTHGDYSYTALAMTIRTGGAWTVEAVRNVVRKIRTTDRGGALCAAAGLRPNKLEIEEA